MSQPSATELLLRLQAGDRSVVDQLFSVVYEEMRAIARRQLKGNSQRNRFSSSELVHEAYLKLIHGDQIDVSGRSHFFTLSAKAMRQILVDQARAQASQKRGGDVVRIQIDEQLLTRDNDSHVLAIDEAIKKLEQIDPLQAQIVESRFFGGMTVEEVAHSLGKSKRWVESEWTMIRAWLRAELSEG